ncbi:hypothetical protein ACNKHO_26285 [Shigella flexneri]
MHGNSEMQKINQTSAMPEKTDVHWSGRFSVAPMLDWTAEHCRYTALALPPYAAVHRNGDYRGPYSRQGRLSAYSEEEHPVALQLGQRSGCAGAVRNSGRRTWL